AHERRRAPRRARGGEDLEVVGGDHGAGERGAGQRRLDGVGDERPAPERKHVLPRETLGAAAGRDDAQRGHETTGRDAFRAAAPRAAARTASTTTSRRADRGSRRIAAWYAAAFAGASASRSRRGRSSARSATRPRPAPAPSGERTPA